MTSAHHTDRPHQLPRLFFCFSFLRPHSKAVSSASSPLVPSMMLGANWSYARNMSPKTTLALLQKKCTVKKFNKITSKTNNMTLACWIWNYTKENSFKLLNLLCNKHIADSHSNCLLKKKTLI